MFYAFPSICALICVIVILYLFHRYKLGDKLLLSPQSKRHNGGKGLIRVGGIVVGIIFFTILILYDAFIFDKKTIVFFIGAFSFMIVGILDDMKQLSWKIQFFLQLTIVIFVIYGGINISFITNPLGGVISFDNGVFYIVGIIIFITWVLGILNALNWSDGMHGIFGGISTISLATIGILSLRDDVFQPPVALMSFVLCGALIGFLIVHLIGRRIIIGTAGTNFVGYVIAVLALFSGAKIGTALLVLIVPLMDAVYVLYSRFKNKVNIFSADTSHLHHRLLSIGWTKHKILLVYYLLTLLGSSLALLTQAINKFIILFIYGIVLLVSFMLFTKVVYNFEKIDRK